MKPNNLQPEDLSKLARDIASNLVFTSSQMKEYELQLIPQVFMPIMFGALGDYSEDEVKNIGFTYGYYSNTFPRSLNGLPMFTQIGFVNKEDAKTIWEKVEKARKALEEI